MANEFDVLIKFLLDQGGVDKTVKGAKDVDAELKKLWETFGKDAHFKTFDEFKKASLEATVAAGKEESAVIKSVQNQIKYLRLLAKEKSLQAREMTRTASDIDRIANPLAIGGTALVGGIMAAAKKYVDNAKEATSTTIAWKAAEDDVAKSGAKIGAVLAKEALPMLQDSAKIMAMAADFLEKNPGVAAAALKVGTIAVALGTIGKLVSGGLRLVADFKMEAALNLQMTAAEMQLEASTNQLMASGKNVTGAGVSSAGGASSLGKNVGNVVLVASAVIIGVEVGTLIGNAIASKIYGQGYKNQGLADAALTATRIPKLPVILAGEIYKKIGLEKLGQGLIDTASKVDNFTQKLLGLRGAADTAASSSMFGSNQASAVKAYTQYHEADIAATKQYTDARNKIISDGANAIAKLNSSNASAIEKINSGYSTSVARSNSNYASTISKAINSAAKEAKKAEEQNALERSKIVRDGSLEIQRLEQDHQDRMAKLQQEHDQNNADLIDARDALGLYKEQKRFADAQNEEEANTNKEIEQRRQDLGIKLQDLAASAAAERQQRAQQLQETLAEAAAQHAQELQDAAAQRDEQLKAQAESYKNEMEQTRANQEQSLKELADNYNAERQQRRQALIDQLDELGIALGRETMLKRQYEAQMLADVTAFVSGMRAITGRLTATASGVAVPTHDYSGYAYHGIYAMAQNRQREYVLSGSATRTAEALIGGQLNQQSLLNAIAGGSAGMQYIDNSRYTNVGARDARQIRQIVRGEIQEMFKR